jgi:hypothetical protein
MTKKTEEKLKNDKTFQKALETLEKFKTMTPEERQKAYDSRSKRDEMICNGGMCIDCD